MMPAFRIPLTLPASLADEAAARGWTRVVVDRGGAKMLSDMYGVPIQPTTVRPRGWSGARTIGGQEYGLERNPAVIPERWRGTTWEPGVVETMHRSDAVLRAIALSWELHIRQVPIDVVPGGTDARDLQVARFVRACLWDYMDGGWAGWMESAASYPWRTPGLWTVGWRMDAAAGRQHGIDGPARVIDRTLQLLPSSVQRWVPDGARWGVVQWPDTGDRGYGSMPSPSGPIRAIDLIHVTWDPVGPAPEGVSLYRPAWWPYQLRQTLGPLIGVAAERGAHALPVARPGLGATRADLPAVMDALQNFRAGAYGALAIPADGWEIEFPRIETIIDQLQSAYGMAAREMAIATLTPWLMTGQDNGTEALIRGQFDPYVLAVTAAAEKLARVWSDGPEAWIRRLVDANYVGVSMYPFLRVSPLVMASAGELIAVATGALTSGGLTPGPSVEAWIRDRIGIPPAESGAAWERRTVGVAEVAAPAATDDAAPRRDSVRLSDPGGVPEWWMPGCPTTGPRGRPVRPVEGVVRLAETTDTLDIARERVGAIVHRWMLRAGREYIRAVIEAQDTQAARRVWFPRVRELTEQLEAEYLDGWRAGAESQLSELRRAIRSPSLRAAIRSGTVRQGAGIAPPARLAECGCGWHRFADLGPVKQIDPKRAARGAAGTTADATAARVKGAILARMQNATVAGRTSTSLNLDDILDAALEALSQAPGKVQVGKDINALFGLGRLQQIGANEGAIEAGVYSTLLESDVCPECEERDGTIVPPSRLDEYATPASWCLGGDSCRCLLLAVPTDDATLAGLVDVTDA